MIDWKLDGIDVFTLALCVSVALLVNLGVRRVRKRALREAIRATRPD